MTFDHLIGDGNQRFSFLPTFPIPKFASKEARRRKWSEDEKRELIDEDGEASNLAKLRLEDSHYVLDL